MTEESVLFVSIIKWVLLASCCGAIVGASTSLFLKLLSGSITLAGRYEYTFFLLPLAMLASSLLTLYVAPQARGHGTEKVIESIHKSFGKIPALVAPVKLVATIITLALGGSAGKEGPCAQIGGALSSLFAGILRLDPKDHKKL
ncbi:MAG: chloride channel protein, partial [Sedimentisphaerales bacterium]|nr:chloride channel protein [Sedimentisphaerales bacterium]